MKKSSRTIEQDKDGAEAELRAAIGKRISDRRRKLGLSARHVAEKLGISREAVTHIETGRNNIHAVVLWKLATLLNCDPATFFPEVPNGYALTREDKRKLQEEGGEKAAQWGERLFGKTQLGKQL
jgi:transcriptional regulator with XRE-family HTH domain